MTVDEHGPTGRSGNGKPILIVDDDPGHRIACRELLEVGGYIVVEAADGRKALHLLMDPGQTPPAMMLLDLSMPIMDGWDFLAIIKSYVRLHDIPVILLSAHEPSLDPVQHSTISAYIRKPYDPGQFMVLVRSFVQG